MIAININRDAFVRHCQSYSIICIQIHCCNFFYISLCLSFSLSLSLSLYIYIYIEREIDIVYLSLFILIY